MHKLNVQDIAHATSADLLVDSARLVQDVVIDSRKVGDGSLFVCFPGERVDGNDYAAAAMEAGAACVALTREPTEELIAQAHACDCALLRAAEDDATRFLTGLAHSWRRMNGAWTVVAVTGSVGKTTTKDMLAAGLATAGKVFATPANLNTLLGCALTLLSADETDRFVICEMGVDGVGDMAPLTTMAEPDLAVITNIGTSHLGNFGTREAIAREKAQVAHGMGRMEGTLAPVLAMPADDDFFALVARDFAAPSGVAMVSVGTGDGCDVRATSVTLDDESHPTVMVSLADGQGVCATLDVLGTHVVADYLLALGVCWKAGINVRAAAEGIAHMRRTALRMEVKTADGRPRVIDDSYNASPSSMAAALDVLASMRCEGRRAAVLGEIGELGEDAPRLHGYVGAYAAAKGLDLVVFVGTDNARHMIEAARTMGVGEERIESYPSSDAALAALKDRFTTRDLVLVKGSRFMGLDAFARGVLA